MPPPPSVRSARLGTAAAFLQQGVLTGGWALQIPLLMARLEIDEAAMGRLIVAFGLGSLAAMLALGPVIALTGSRAVARAGMVVSSFFLAAMALAPGIGAATAAAVVMGGAIGATDLAMNAGGVEVERRAGRALMSSLHGWWSVGALAGALASGPAISAFGGPAHAAAFGAVALALAALAWPRLLDDREVRAAGERVALGVPRAPVVWALALVVLMAFVVEGAVIDWSALYVTAEIAAPLAWGGVALAGLQVSMAAMRFAGDRVRERVGDGRLVAGGALLAALGFAVAGLAGLPSGGAPPVARALLVALGFGLAGLGLANVVPIAFAAAGRVEGVPRALAMSVVTAFGYAGLLLAPSTIGMAAGRVGFAPTYLALAALPLAVAAMAGAVARPGGRDAGRRAAPPP